MQGWVFFFSTIDAPSTEFAKMARNVLSIHANTNP
jgi:hypothetical protein